MSAKAFDFKPAPRPERVGDRCSKQMEDGKHRVGWCSDSSSSREAAWMEFSETTSGGAYLKLHL
jgi:hypothetical protein